MLLFWVFATLMTAVALAFVLFPLLRSRHGGGRSAREANLEVLRGQRREIEADVERGVLPAAAREEALSDLVARAQADLPPDVSAPAATHRRPWLLAAIVAVALPALTFGVYLAVGTPAAGDPKDRGAPRTAPRRSADPGDGREPREEGARASG
jgi:cytochrome c-type biogenesis protein CcmH